MSLVATPRRVPLSFTLTDFPIGSYWKRSDIHALLGGQEQGGISTPSKKPYIIIFSSPRGEEFGYEDGWNADGYSRPAARIIVDITTRRKGNYTWRRMAAE